MEFLDACLFWMGQVNRNDLARRFGVSVPQASADLARYRDLAPGNMIYDGARKAYLAAGAFRRVFGSDAAEATLSALATLAARDAAAAPPPWLDGVEASLVHPPSRRHVRSDVLKAVLASVRGRTAVEIVYQSFSRPEPTRRWIEPHALATDGERWHARAFCRERRDFRDFVLSRIASVGAVRPATAPREADCAWTRHAVLRLAPNPNLPEGVRRGLEVEHAMRGGSMRMKVRVSAFYYVERRLGLDLDPACEPGRTQLVLLNRPEIEDVVVRAEERTRAKLRPVA